MDIEQLVQFRVAAKLSHLGRAAEALNMSQPGISQTIGRLEKRYRVALFDRHGRSLRLNANGKVLLEHAERTLSAHEDLSRAMHDLAASDQESIALGYFGGRNAKAIPYLIRQFHQSHNVVDFGLFRGSNARLLDLLKEGSLDLCFTFRRSTEPAITGLPLWREKLFVYVPRTHRFAARSEVDLAEIADEPMVALMRGSDLRTIVDELCREAGFIPRVVFEGQNIVTLHGLVAAGVGLALAPEPEAPERADVVALNVRAPICERPIYLSWLRERYVSKVARRFRDFILSKHATLGSIGLEPLPLGS